VPPTRLIELPAWPEPFDPRAELDWGDPLYSRRLLREHLDQEHDGASRRLAIVDRHVGRLRTLLPAPPARILDAACGPGLYAVRLAALGYDVTGIDVGEPVLRHARRLARDAVSRGGGSTTFLRADLRSALDAPRLSEPFDACLLVYYVLEAFPRRQQVPVLRRLRERLRPGGRLVIELRTRPAEHPPGRLSHWEEVSASILSDEPHLLLSDTTWDPRRLVYILREVAVLPDGEVAVQQTTGMMSTLAQVRGLVDRAGLRLVAVYDGWSRHRATGLSDELLVVAERPRG
jgi:SAM-dependent methyltransferase